MTSRWNAPALFLLAALPVFGQTEPSVNKFTPAANPFARRMVTEQFTLVEDLKELDPEVLAVFHTKVQPAYIANHGEPFNATDVVTGNLPARRFVLAGRAPGMWFIFYEHGGIAYHQNLIVFSKEGNWQIAAAVEGNVKGEFNFEALKQAIQNGRFFSLSGRPDF